MTLFGDSLATVDEDARRRFESAWKEGQPQPIERFLPPSDHPLHLPTLVELVQVELEFSWKRHARGDGATPVPVAAYLERFPRLNKPEIVRRLMRQESTARQLADEQTTPHDLDVRVPERTGAEPDATLHTEVAPARGRPELPGYEILEEIGRGGMGVVYKALQISLNRLVALKMILAGAQAGEEELLRSRREAEAVAQLQHPHVVQIYEVGEHNGQPYLALEFVAGGTLARRLAGTPQSAPFAAQALETLARTMHRAHQHGIIHRDLKPANVLMTPEGSLKITDFGLAKRLEASPGLTHTGRIMGTPAYVAPEQAAGTNKLVGPAADVYALGAILFEMLTGRPPFVGETAWDVLTQAINTEPVPPSRLNPRVPRDLETICLKCLEKDPARRYASAELLADDVKRFAAGEPIHARPLRPWQRLAKWAQRKPAIAALSALVVVVTLAGFAGISWQWQQAEKNRRTAEERAQAEERIAKEKTAALLEAQRNLYFHQIGLADRNWWDDDLAAARRLLKATPPEVRHLEWELLNWRCRSPLLTIPTTSRCLAFDSVKGLLATGSGGRVILWNLAGEKVRTLDWPDHPIRDVYCVAFAPDGSYVAAGGDETTDVVPVWRVDTGEVVHRLHDHVDGVPKVEFSPDGRQLACGTGSRGGGQIVLWDLASGNRQHVLKGLGGGWGHGFDQVAYSPDGTRLAGTAEDYEVGIWDPRTGKKLRVIKGYAHDLAFSPDSRYLAIAAVEKGKISLWEVEKGDAESASIELGVEIVTLAFDGNQRLAGAGADGAIRVWNWRTGELVRLLRGHEGLVGQVAFSGDGSRLASVGAVLHLWNLDADQEAPLLAHYTDRFALHPDGSRLATATHGNHTVTIWDTLSTCVERTLPGTGQAVNSLAFAPDRPLLAIGYADGSVVLTDAASGQQARKLHHPQLQALAFSRDGLSLATTGTSPTDRHADVRVWDAGTGALRQHWTTSFTDIGQVTFAGESGQLFVAGSESGNRFVQRFDAGTGQSLARWSTGKRSRVAYDPSTQRLAAGAPDSDVVLITVPDGAQRSLAKTSTRALAFSPDGLRLATADQSIRLWDVETGNETLNLTIPRRFFPKYFFTDKEKQSRGIFFTDVQVTAQVIAGRTCEGSTWLWRTRTPAPRQVRTTKVSFQSGPLGALSPDALAAYGIRWEGDVEAVKAQWPQSLYTLPLGYGRATSSRFTKQLTDTRTFHFAEPLRGFAFTHIGVVNGASMARWRLEALDSEGNVLATTGEMEFSKDPYPRTCGVRADGIRSVRLWCDNDAGIKMAYASLTSIPVVEFILER